MSDKDVFIQGSEGRKEKKLESRRIFRQNQKN